METKLNPADLKTKVGAAQETLDAWDQPHEGNLFDHLYGRRAFQSASGLIGATDAHG